MPKIVVFTDDGQPVWEMDDVEWHHVTGLTCPTNTRGSSVASGIRRAISDAHTIQDGGDPERPSEKAMRLASVE